MLEVCPGVASSVLTPRQALAKAGDFLAQWGSSAVVGIAGPGDPLANQEAFDTLSLIRAVYSHARLCLCTNGLSLPGAVPTLHALDVQHLSITINSVDPEVTAEIHPRVRLDDTSVLPAGKYRERGARTARGGDDPRSVGQTGRSRATLLHGLAAGRLLIERQLAGLKEAVSRGLHVKVNTVVIPGVNEAGVEDVARRVADLGAGLINIMPLIPRGQLSDQAAPSPCAIKSLRERCARYLPVFDKCKQCRADAEGIPAKSPALPRGDEVSMDRRRFLKASGLAITGSLAAPTVGNGAEHKGQRLQVWSCGGLAEAFVPANREFERLSGCTIAYTGAFAAALGKSLLGGAQTEVFAPRVLELALKLKDQGKMLHFKPLCFTKYVLITPKGNPAGISGIADLARPGVRTVLSPDASPPGGQATLGILKKAGVLEAAQQAAVRKGDCVQRDVADIVSGAGDVAVVEQRMTRLPDVAGRVEVIDIPEEFVPAKPVPFVIGVMKWAASQNLAQDFVDFMTAGQGQAYFEAAGFVPALSEEGHRLAGKYGVQDV